ncbi:hypothetical protein J3R30DRAFT_171917 [Lentinula aciculospora]|uniref:Uncharacterized protein n=1 Tax=Lentinula aciculospora TaxID=153920 RepID=A0A9W9DNC3_9AGAR|nr:hypothetical protein J3R30DRAFT_171917 [Lentinula aciculospora]
MAEAARQTVRLLKSLVANLPDSSPLATAEDRINQIFKSIPELDDSDERWPVFNRRMDNLFGHDICNNNVRLINILRGPYGMDLVVGYCQHAVDGDHLLWDAAVPKFACLITELQFL